MATVDRKGRKLGKGKRRDAAGSSSASSKKRRVKDLGCEEVVTMDQSDSAEHTQLLMSVTGKIKRLRQYEEGPDGEREEGDVKGNSKGDTEELSADPVAGKGTAEEGTGVDKEAAAQYLVLWNSQRDLWTFKKKTQYWLLQNMYDKKKVSKANFKLMLLYLDGLRGNQRALAKEKAEKVIAKKDSEEGDEFKIAYKRARSVSKILSQ